MSTLEGKPAPAFSLPGSDGKVYEAAALKGRTVVLYFYPKDDTPGCTKEACGFRDLDARIASTGALVLGISRDGAESHGQFIAKYGLPFVLLSDPELEAHRAYGAWGEKISYGKTTMGVIRSTFVIGADGRIVKQWQPVRDAAPHPEEVLAFLNSPA